jgi:hypothetical protein
MTTRRYGGFTEVARELSKVSGKQISRQLVYAWWRRRGHNGFPDRSYRDDSENGKPRGVFSIEETVNWLTHYVPSPGGRARKEPRPRACVSRL